MRDLRNRIIEVATNAGEGHIPSALSVLDLIYVLYKSVLTLNDKFILSKGHAALALYAVLEHFGKITKEDMDSFCDLGSKLGGHPDSLKIPGVECSTGSLGHGLPQAVGMAMAMRGQPGRVFCLVGDGECNEGTIWESALLASHYKLENLCLIVDDNKSSPLALGSIADKLIAFGFAGQWARGHEHDMIEQALQPAPYGKPVCIIAETVKGYGCLPMEADPKQWHHRVPKSAEESATLAENMRP